MARPEPIRIDIRQTAYQSFVNGMTLPDDILRGLVDEFGVMGDCEVDIHDRIRGPETWRWDADAGTWIDPDGNPYALQGA